MTEQKEADHRRIESACFGGGSLFSFQVISFCYYCELKSMTEAN